MAMIKTELCTETKTEGLSALSEYQLIDVKHEAVDPVLKSEVKVRVMFLKPLSVYQAVIHFEYNFKFFNGILTYIF